MSYSKYVIEIEAQLQRSQPGEEVEEEEGVSCTLALLFAAAVVYLVKGADHSRRRGGGVK